MDMKFLFLCSVFLFIYSPAASEDCECQVGCECSGTSATCSNINAFPSCFPNGTTSLTVNDSPRLESIDAIPSYLSEVYISNTGLIKIQNDVIANALGLQTLSLTENVNLGPIDMGHPVPNPMLKKFIVENATSLTDVKNINYYTNLVRITISGCNLLSIDEEMFENLRQVQYLDVSYNSRLSNIDEEAFEDLDSLQVLILTGCKLQKLYGEYFDNAYHKNLRSVKALLNPYQCQEMCDFMQWFWGHRSFYNYAFIGSCTIPGSSGTVLYYPSVFDLTRYEAGCPPVVGIILGATLGAFFFICLAACLFVVVCGIDYRKYCCFCCDSQRNREEAARASEGNRQDHDVEHHHYETPYPNGEKVNLQGPMYAAAPPSYEDITSAVGQAPTNTMTLEDAPASASSST